MIGTFSDLVAALPWFMLASGLVILVYLLLDTRERGPVEERLGEISQTRHNAGGIASARVVDDRGQHWVDRQVRREQKKAKLKDRLTHAGLYRPTAASLFIITRVILALGPAVFGYVAAKMGLFAVTPAIVLGISAGLAGTLAPSFWLDHVKRSRQTRIRRALPDAMDVMAVCLEGGLSFPGSLLRVSRELATAHPMLALELQIVERQTQMGRTTGEALKEMAKRFDLEELRSLAAVVIQAERIGSSISDALQVFADALRTKRHQRAEEMAQKAAIKLIFPTLFFIFPGIFIVILGPAAIQIYQVLMKGVMTR